MLEKDWVLFEAPIKVPKVFPITSKMDSFHSSNGMSYIHTQTRVVDGRSTVGLNPICHGFINTLAFPRNHGPL